VFFADAAGQTVDVGAAVPLNNSAAGNTAGAFTLASSQVTVTQAGLYMITYTVAIEGGTTGVYQLFQNAAGLPGTIGTTENNGNFGHMLIGFTLVPLNAGDLLSIRNISDSADVLQSGSAGVTNPTSAMLSIVKIG
jgi:hypothetical protein